jgi:hypothetical protein
MSDTSPNKEVFEENAQQGLIKKRDPEDLQGLTNLEAIEADFRKALDIDKRLAEHLVLRQEFASFYMESIRSTRTGSETDNNVEEKIAGWMAKLKAARAENDELKKDSDLLALWRTWATTGYVPPLSALSLEDSKPPTTEDSDLNRAR